MPEGGVLIMSRSPATMRLSRPSLLSLSALLLWSLLSLLPWTAQAMRADTLATLRMETVEMFYHGYNNYMQHGFPEDELRPLTCAPLSRDRDDPGHIGLNDALGNYSLTLIDSLSTLAILAGAPPDDLNTGPQALRDFQSGVAQFVSHYGDGRLGPTGQGTRARGFDLDSKVQVFETVIRGVGGLLSAHLFAIGELPIAGYEPKSAAPWEEADDPLEIPPIHWPEGFEYDGQLLRLALDLSQRLLPAFYTETGIPYPRVNLRHGIPFYTNSPLNRPTEEGDGAAADEDESREITETCSAGAGSLTLEFTVLTRLTGDLRFEQAGKRAFWEVWGRRSEIGLIGNGIDAERGMWIGPHAGIGAGMDSFFEYALKSHILLSGKGVPPNATAPGDIPPRKQHPADWLDPNSIHAPLPPEMHTSEAFLEAWHQAHASVKRYLYTDRSAYPYYANTHRSTGQPYTMWIDSLGAFYPGLLALAGEVEEAIEANLVYTALWTRYAALPERWSFRDSNVESGLGWWPGRPEFVESTYYIYRATRDPWYLHVGEMVLRDIKWRCYAPCGWAGLQDVRTGEKQDRMESFFLGETTKYMYLLFDPDHQLNKLDAPFVFTTEGHPLIIPKRRRRRGASTAKSQSARYKPGSAGEMSLYNYFDEAFTNSCPAPVAVGDLTVSATASRPDLFSVSRFTDLHNTPNIHGPLEAVQVEDRRKGSKGSGGRVTKYRPLSNYTVFPWTLPTSLLPSNGSCAAPVDRIVAWVEFPASDTLSSVVSLFANSLKWVDHRGPTVRSLEGLRLQLEREESEDRSGELVWRIAQIGVTQLGRRESVFFHAENVRHLKDEAFTTVRRQDVVAIELMIDYAELEEREKRRSRRKRMERARSRARSGTSNASIIAPTAPGMNNNDEAPLADPQHAENLENSEDYDDDSYDFDDEDVTADIMPESPPPPPPGSCSQQSTTSLLKTLLRAVTSVFDPSYTSVPSPADNDSDPRGPALHSWLGYTAVGPGAFPVPSVPDTPLPGGPSYNSRNPSANFPWSTIYLAGLACDAPLPESAPRDHHVIVLRRGGCSFAQKLANVPSFSPASKSLQIVVVVDDGDDPDPEPTRPLLDTEQLTPGGMKRLHGVPLVLLTTEPGGYELFAQATAIGMRRKYDVHSQGLLVENAIVL